MSNLRAEREKRYRDNNPWIKSLNAARQRCNDPKHKSYSEYGGRGIRIYLTVPEIKELWERDKAWMLKKPSLDRINNDGNYEFGNCQFIEQRLNIRKWK